MADAKLITISGVSERDIDLLLMEEFIASPAFCDWFLSHISFPEARGSRIEDVKRSVTDSTGESDLEITLINSNQQTYKILIENKVNAGFQPEQAERYTQRGENYLQNSEICNYTTVLVAPEAYFQNEFKGFNARVNYEMICAWFANQRVLGERLRYKLSLLHSAIEKGTTGYQIIADAAVTRFWAAYWALVQEIAPELQMEEPGHKPAGSAFIYFRGYDLPKGISLCHKLQHGMIDFQFAGMSEKLSTLQERYAARMPEDMRITRAGKSGVIRSAVPCLSVANDIDAQKHDTIHGIKTAQYMLKWYHQA